MENIEIRKFCTACGTANTEGKKFCSSCGANLVIESEAKAEPAVLDVGASAEPKVETPVSAPNPAVIRKNIIKSIKKSYSAGIQGVLYQQLIMNILQIGAMMIALIPIIIKVASEGISDFETVQSMIQGSLMGNIFAFAAVSGIPADLAGAAIVLKLSKIKVKDGFKSMFAKSRLNIAYAFIGGFGILGVSHINVLVMNLIGGIFETTSSALDNSMTFDPNGGIWGFWLPVLYVGVLGPICEEILCRGAILRAGMKVNKVFGMVFSALLFGIMHMNLIQGVNATVMGLILAYVTIKAGSIIPAIIMHMINNIFAILPEIIHPYFEGTTFGNILEYYPYIFIGVGLVCVAILFATNRGFKEEDVFESGIEVKQELLDQYSIKKGEVLAKPVFTTISVYILLVLFIVNAGFIALAGLMR